nr:PAS domain S-box protein [Streptomyces rimosus]
MESSQDAILIKTLDGQVTFWNAAAQRLYGYRAQEVVGRHIGWLYGYRAQEVVGRHIGLLIPPDLKDEEADLLERIGRGERIEHYETRRATSDGRVLDVDVPRP